MNRICGHLLVEGRVARPFGCADTTTLWVPRPCVFCKGGYDAAESVGLSSRLTIPSRVRQG